MLEKDNSTSEAPKVPKVLLTKTCWQSLALAAEAGNRFTELGQQKVRAVRPELVIIFTLKHLLQANTPDDQRNAVNVLDLIGGFIRDAACTGFAAAWFEISLWEQAVQFSAGLPGARGASWLYMEESLTQLLKQLSHFIQPQRGSPMGTLPLNFFRYLLMVSLSLCVLRKVYLLS